MDCICENTHGAPGPAKTTKDAVLETGASVTQSFGPVKAICAHLNAFHVYANDTSRSVEANHYCTHLSADVSFSSLSRVLVAKSPAEARMKARGKR